MLNISSADSDYSSLRVSLTFFPGDTIGSPPRCVSIAILDDEIVEAEETFAVVLSSNSEIQIINNVMSTHVTIYEDSSDCESLTKRHMVNYYVLWLSTVVTVGLRPLMSTVRENETFLVCAELTLGSLGRDVYVGLEAENRSAIRICDMHVT